MENSGPVTGKNADADVLAVRALIAQSDQTEEPPRAPSEPIRTPRASLPDLEAVDEPSAQSRAPKKPSVVTKRSKAIAAALWSRVRSYRPQTKSVLVTSLVLLVLLQPAFVLGWSLFCLFVVVGCYFLMGGDLFWRRIISLYKKVELVRPALARRVKVHAYIFSRKWEKLTRKIPGRVAGHLQLPDFRLLLAADARHDAALNDRLSRLQ